MMDKKSCANLDKFDLVIIGGGLCALAQTIALANLPLTIAVVETTSTSHDQSNLELEQHEIRALALSAGSCKFLLNLNVWPQLQEWACPINQIHISDRGHFGFTRMDAKQYRIESFGSVVPMHRVQQILSQKARQATNIKFFSGFKLTHVQTKQHCNELCLVQQNINSKTILLQASLVIAADGSQSQICRLLGVPAKEISYKQTALVANVGIARSRTSHIAYERFTEHGPLALLPISNTIFSLVWTLPDDIAKLRMTEAKTKFLQALQYAFGDRLGRFISVGSRKVFPLMLIKRPIMAKERIMVIGNAAHTLHPVAGQGFNLGLRDVAQLSTLIKQAMIEKSDFSSIEFLLEFVRQRKKDINTTITWTDTAVKIFSTNCKLHSLIRSWMLLGLDTCWPLKKQFIAKAMGIPIL